MEKLLVFSFDTGDFENPTYLVFVRTRITSEKDYETIQKLVAEYTGENYSREEDVEEAMTEWGRPWIFADGYVIYV